MVDNRDNENAREIGILRNELQKFSDKDITYLNNRPEITFHKSFLFDSSSHTHLKTELTTLKKIRNKYGEKANKIFLLFRGLKGNPSQGYELETLRGGLLFSDYKENLRENETSFFPLILYFLNEKCLKLKKIDLIHNDIKPNNIIFHPWSQKFTLLDFDISKKIDDPVFHGISEHYSPREKREGCPYTESFEIREWNEKNEVFSLGASIIAILKEIDVANGELVNYHGFITPEEEDRCEFKRLLKRMVSLEQVHRPGFEQIRIELKRIFGKFDGQRERFKMEIIKQTFQLCYVEENSRYSNGWLRKIL